MLFCNSGVLTLPETSKTPEGIRARILLTLMTFFITLYTLLRSVACHITRKLPGTVSGHCQNITELTPGATQKEEHSPSPPLSQADLLSSVLKRLVELEEKVDTLQAKPSVMPYDKEELLNAAVCRVDALEAELIAAKKVMLAPLILLLFTKPLSIFLL